MGAASPHVCNNACGSWIFEIIIAQFRTQLLIKMIINIIIRDVLVHCLTPLSLPVVRDGLNNN